MALVIVGAGILGLSVAEAASRRTCEKVIVIEDPGNPGASYAAAAQLGLKGQSVSKSEEFRLKIAGQRSYEQWIASWGLNSAELSLVPQWFRRGKGRDHVLSDAEFAEQKRRIEKHEGEVFPAFFGPSLVFSQSDKKSLSYLLEVAIDARQMLAVLRSVLQRRGVQFLQLDAAEVSSVETVVSNVRQGRADGAGGCSLVMCAGASTFELLNSWGIAEDCFASKLLPSAKRVNVGATVICRESSLRCPATGKNNAKLDFGAYVMEGFLDRSNNEIVAVTRFAEKLFVTSLSAPLADDLWSSLCAQARLLHKLEYEQSPRLQTLFRTQIEKLKRLFEKHGFQWALPQASVASSAQFCDLRVGLRMRATKSDLLLEKLPLSTIQGADQIIVFAGANRSGYLYGPALAGKVLSLHSNRL